MEETDMHAKHSLSLGCDGYRPLVVCAPIVPVTFPNASRVSQEFNAIITPSVMLVFYASAAAVPHSTIHVATSSSARIEI